MKVRFKRNISGNGFRFRIGQEAELSEERAKDFLKAQKKLDKKWHTTL